MSTNHNDKPSELRREVGLGLFLFYGIGNIVGAGIYVLIGKVAGAAGYGAPVAFLVAAVVAGLTGRSYGELAARYPQSSGEAIYLFKAFRLQTLSTAVGLMIAMAGLVSAATITHGFVGYLSEFVSVPRWLVIITAILLLTFVAIRGIVESAILNAVFTVLQVGGLFWLIGSGAAAMPTVVLPDPTDFIPLSAAAWSAVFAGAFLAFYAFIGFEDMVNIAEEVREPRKTIPHGIMLAFALSSIIYVILTLVAVLLVLPVELSGSDAPLSLICEIAPGCAPGFISLIGLTVLNGALIQVIMASRIFYGMSRAGWLPEFLSRVDVVRRTPVTATVIAGGITLFMALALPFLSLAKLTSALVLTIFVLVNASLIVIKRRGDEPVGVNLISIWIPVLGLAGSLLMLLV